MTMMMSVKGADRVPAGDGPDCLRRAQDIVDGQEAGVVDDHPQDIGRIDLPQALSEVPQPEAGGDGGVPNFTTSFTAILKTLGTTKEASRQGEVDDRRLPGPGVGGGDAQRQHVDQDHQPAGGPVHRPALVCAPWPRLPCRRGSHCPGAALIIAARPRPRQ